MKKTVLIGWLVLWAATALAATPLSDAEKHRLASYLSYIVVGVETQGPGGGSLYTVGANCPECNGVGKVGDGVTMLTCEWEDGLYYCASGKVAKRSDGDQMDVCEVGCALCESVCTCGNCDGNCGGGCCENCTCPTPERDELFDDLANVPKRADESYVLYLERQLQLALEESGMGKQECPDCPTCVEPEPVEDQPETIEEAPACLTDLSQTQWNWQGTSNVPISEMRRHLTDEHSIDPASLDKMSREELIALHNLLHNEEVRASTPQAKSKPKTYSSGGCPGGQCPTGPSRSYSRGLFGRRR